MRFDYFSLVFYALIAGAILPAQAALNAQMARFAGSSGLAALISFAVGTLVLSVYFLCTGAKWPPLSQLMAAPWWLWLGGLLGAFYVAGAVVLAPRLGVATMIGIVIAGQMIASLLIDHFGLLGIPQHSLTPARLFGAVLLVSAVFLIRRF